MQNQFSRTELLIGKTAVEKLQKSKVAIFGIGGVGSFVVEALVRSGVENFILVDKDIIDITNINRQIIATTKTVGKPKVETYQKFFMPETKGIINETIDYIVDCIDTVTAKIELVVRSNILNIPIISSMGTGNKLDATKFEITDIYKTTVCPLAKVMRKELKNRNIKKLKVVYSKEEPIKHNIQENKKQETKEEKQKQQKQIKKQVPASISYVPSVAGLIIAGEVIKDLIK